MNIEGPEATVEACQKCYASLFTDRAIRYREHNGFDHMKVALSAGVQKMVRSDKASAGVGFTILPDSGYDKILLLTGAWGLGDNVVQGVVNADEFYVFKPALKKGMRSIISKKIGSKEKTMIYAGKSDKGEETTKNKNTSLKKKNEYVLNDKEVERLAMWSLEIEEHYGRAMDILFRPAPKQCIPEKKNPK
jgi:pyruvate,water dikinase